MRVVFGVLKKLKMYGKQVYNGAAPKRTKFYFIQINAHYFQHIIRSDKKRFISKNQSNSLSFNRIFDHAHLPVNPCLTYNSVRFLLGFRFEYRIKPVHEQ